MNTLDQKYKDMLRHILKNGRIKTDRTGTGTISVFDYTITHNMSDGFPLLTSKKMYWKGIVHELLWFLSGSTNIKYLVENDCHIWDGDAYKAYSAKITKMIESWDAGYDHVLKTQADGCRPFSKEKFVDMVKTDPEFAKIWGELGPIYGAQWRNWGGKNQAFKMKDVMGNDFPNQEPIKGVDQIQNLISELKENPDSRRLMVNAWNVGEIGNMTLPPCHYGFQCYTYEMGFDERLGEWLRSIGKSQYYGEDITSEKLDELNFPKRKLSLKATIRSNDIFLGNPYNLASYGLLLIMLGKEVNMIPDDLIISIGDAHIYLNHVEQCKIQLERETFPLPQVVISNRPIFDIGFDDIRLVDYKSAPVLKGELSN